MNILPKTLYFLSIVTFAMYACKTTDGTSTRDNKKEGAVVGLANGILNADGKTIYKAENLKVGLFKS